MTRVVTAMRWCAAILLVAVIAITGTLNVLHLSGWKILVIRSGSMGATAPTGSVALVRPVHDSAVVVGNVVLLQANTAQPAPRTPVLHRVTALEPTVDGIAVRTKGDTNAVADLRPHVLEARPLRLALTLPGAGYLLDAVTHWTVRLTLVLVPATAGLLVVLRRLWGLPLAPSADEPATAES